MCRVAADISVTKPLSHGPIMHMRAPCPRLPSLGGWVFIGLLMASVLPAPGANQQSHGTNVGLTFNLWLTNSDFNVQQGRFALLPCEPFSREPDLAGRSVLRALWRITRDPQANYEVPLLWDYSEGDLYLEPNRYREQTTNSLARYHSPQLGDRQLFEGIRLELPIAGKLSTYQVNLELVRTTPNQPYGIFTVRSFWSAPIELQGRTWQLVVIDNLPERIRRSRLTPVEPDCVVLRPWESHERALGRPGEKRPDQGDQIISPFKNIFIQRQCYDLSFGFDQANGVITRTVTFEEHSCPLGELNVVGQSIQSIVLRGEHQIILDSPPPRLQAPVGVYGALIRLQAPRSNQPPFSVNCPPVRVAADSPAYVRVGAPLANGVRITRLGDRLIFRHEVLSAAGSPLSVVMGRMAIAPRLSVYNRDTLVVADSFRFG